MIKAITRTLLILILFVCAIITFLLTPTGLRTTIGLATHFLPGKLSVKNVSGVIIGPIKIKSLRYQTKEETILIRNLILNWSPTKLLEHKINITRLHATSIEVDITGQKKQPPLEERIEAILASINSIIHQKQTYKLSINNTSLNAIRVVIKSKGHSETTSLHHIIYHEKSLKDHVAIQLSGKLTQPADLTVHFTLSGTQKNQRFQTTISGKQTHWVLSGKRTPTAISIKTTRAQLLQGTLNAQLTIVNGHHWQGQLHAKHLNLSDFSIGLPKTLNLSWESSGQMSNHFQTKNKLVFSLANNKVITQFNFDKTLSVTWQGELPGLQAIAPRLNGKLSTSGTIKGLYPKLVTTGNVTVNQLSLNHSQIGQIKAKWHINFAQQSPSTFELLATHIKNQDNLIKQLSLAGNGTITDHHLKAQIIFPERSLTLSLRGNFHQLFWNGIIKTLTLKEAKQTWAINKPFQLGLSDTKATLSPFCLQSKTGSKLCAKGNWSKTQPFSFQVTGKQLPLAWLSDWRKDTITPQGQFNLHTNFERDNKKHYRGHFSLSSEGLTINVHHNGDEYTQPIKKLVLKAQYEKQQLTNTLILELNKHDKLHTTLALPKFSLDAIKDQSQQISGQFYANFHSLKWIANWIPNIQISKGGLKANLKLAGTIAKPLVTGNLNMMDTFIELPKPNLSFSNIKVDLKGQGSQISFNAHAQSDGKPINLAGNFDLAKRLNPFIFHINTENAKLINLPDYQASITSQLTVKILDKDIYINGNIEVPSAQIKPGDLHSTDTLPTDDIIYVNQPKLEKPSGWRLYSDITVTLGKNVHVQAHGVDAYASGQVTLINKPNSSMIAAGKIAIDKGSFSVYGKTLKISKDSTINYAHDTLDNPLLNIQATKSIPISSATGFNVSGSEIIVGISATGNLKTPKITFFSKPATLSQSEVLSYIVLGYANQSSGTSGNTDFLLRALSAASITSQGLLGKQNIASQIQSGLGLNELGVESETSVDALGNPLQHQSAFVVGKHLTKNLYLRYSFGITDAVNVFQVRYIFNKNWAIQADSSVLGNGADILYTIEKD